MPARVGDLLVRQGMVGREQLRVALQHQSARGGRLGSILIELGYTDEHDVAAVLGQKYGVPSVGLSHFRIDPQALQLIEVEKAIRHKVLPLQQLGATLSLAMADPTDLVALDEIKFITGLRVEPVVAPESSVNRAIKQYYGREETNALREVYRELAADGEHKLDISEKQEDVDLGELQKSSAQAPIVKLVNIILAQAIHRRASDIHIEPYEQDFRVRYRIDGSLAKVMNPPLRFRDALISRIKITAKLDISQRRLPQDGRIKVRINQKDHRREIDFRVSCLPTLFGEKIVLRILDRAKLPLELEQLGFEPRSLKRLHRSVQMPHGMVLVTGPTGSGKTSTLYTCLNQINTPELNIMTVEDPIEFNFPGINQVQTSEEAGLTFAAALRAFLRQDPNIILVGEIRDVDTAQIAVKAALTGHLVLSTVHTNDAPATISRLLNMGLERFLVATSVNLVCAQRLARRICPECKEPVSTALETLLEVGFTPSLARQVVVHRGRGCGRCHGTGYRGRVGLFEVMIVSPGIQNLILAGASANQIRDHARDEGMDTLRQSGLAKIGAGITTIEEVIRVTTAQH